MRKYGMDVRVLGLLVSSDYQTHAHADYAAMQTAIGKRCSEIVYTALINKGFRVDFSATLYQIANELVRIAGNLMFGSELQFSDMKYHVDRDFCSLRVVVNPCPICQFVHSDHAVCHVISGFLTGLVHAFLSKFAYTNVDTVETSCIARGDSSCRFDTRWHVPVGLPAPRIQELEIHIDEEALEQKVSEIIATDFYQKAVAFARQRRSVA